jgi:hypothetical protein
MSAEKENARTGEPATGGFGKRSHLAIRRKAMQAHGDGKKRLVTIVRWLAVARELCAEPMPTAGMVTLAGQAVSIAKRIADEILCEVEASTGKP